MPADAANRVNLVHPNPGSNSSLGYFPGDMPDAIRTRYYSQTRFFAGLALYRDARSKTPAFRDHGGRLSTDRNDPAVVRDLITIAEHRRWPAVAVRGHAGFRREVWMTARLAGLDVRGYRPTERDLQDLARRTAARARRERPEDRPKRPDAAKQRMDADGPSSRLAVVETLVKARIVQPSDQARILAAARDRLAGWLERGARFEDFPDRRRNASRQHDR